MPYSNHNERPARASSDRATYTADGEGGDDDNDWGDYTKVRMQVMKLMAPVK